jgi:ppGpp synthetase/RelA/SpoT-type nucleotidyltranferase
MAGNTKTPEEWGQTFSRVRSHYVDCTHEVGRLLEQILEGKDVQVAQLETRTKDVDSFCEKIVRKNEKYDDPLTEITDLVGLRAILYYPDDVTAVGALIEKEFDVDWKHSIRQGADTEPDRFGYRSDHYVVRLASKRRRLAEWKAFGADRIEIQVRTVMQHAWAAVDHKVRFKGKELPVELQRRLFRLSALLEVADEQFAALQGASDEVVLRYEDSVARGDLDIALGPLSLRAYLDQTGATETWEQRALAVGFVPPARALSRDMFDQSVDELLAHLQSVGITTITQVDHFFGHAEAWGDEALAQVVKGTAEHSGLVPSRRKEVAGQVFAIGPDVLSVLVLISGRDAEAVDGTRFRDDISDGIKSAFGSAT